MARQLHTRLSLTNSFLVEYVILARIIVLVLMHALARVLVLAKTPVLALTVAHRMVVVSKIRLTDLPVLNPLSRIFSVPVTVLLTW
jgi:hypothetical protein